MTDPSEVSSHAFYPFIWSVMTTPKIARDPVTREIIKTQKERQICYASHVDSHIYAYYGWQLACRYEEALKSLDLQDSVLAFRPGIGLSNIEFASGAFAAIRSRKHCDVLAFDIKGFFDNLSHDILKREWMRLLGLNALPSDHYKIFRSLVKWQRVEREALFNQLGISPHNPGASCGSHRRLCNPADFRKLVRDAGLIESNATGVGIPQGSSMSAVLSNIYMLTFDDKVHQFADSIGALYFRYCDDMLLIGPSGTGGAIKQFVDNQIKSVGLELQHEKTDELTFDLLVTGPIAKKPLQYLGFCFDGVRTWIRSSSIARFHQRMRRGVRMLLKGAERRNKRRELAGRAPTPLHLKTVYRRYSYLGRRNFLSYGFRSAAALDEETIKGQLRPLWRKLRRKLN